MTTTTSPAALVPVVPVFTNTERLALWTAPGILEALIPGRVQSHASTAEVPR